MTDSTIDSTTYSVITSGELQLGFEPAQVQQALAALFSIEPEKADALMGSRQVIKKGTDLKTAETYKSRLEGIGLVVTLEEQAPALGSTLSLVPLDEVQPESGTRERTPTPQTAAANPNTVTCPKCATEQPRGNEQCQGCGVFMHKVIKQPTESPAARPLPARGTPEEVTITTTHTLTAAGLAAGAGAALLGALIWKFIAIMFGIELGYIAWAIGGLIGFAVTVTGSSGQNAGIACGALALVAILGGKYLAYDSIKDEINAALNDSMDEIHQAYDQEMAAAKAYTDVLNDKALREFMVKYEYSSYYDAEDVTQEEISSFKTDSEPRLVSYAYGAPSFEMWYRSNIENDLAEVSTIGMIKEDFGAIDLLFLVLGVGTAFRLGRGASTE